MLKSTVAAILLCASLTVSSAVAGSKKQTFVGEVSDAACGVHHMMEGSAADCTRTCVRQGAKYVLVVGDKVYTLDATAKAALERLDALAGQKAKITGQATGDAIAVTSVASAR